MVIGFVGRTRELADLDYVLEQVRNSTSDRPGRAIALRGRRRVGTSRLVTEFVGRAAVPSMYFLADGARTELEQRRFLDTVAISGLPGADAAGYAVSGSWQDALTVLALALPRDHVSIVVLDEVSYLTSDPGFEGALQGVPYALVVRHSIEAACHGEQPTKSDKMVEGTRGHAQVVDGDTRPFCPSARSRRASCARTSPGPGVSNTYY